jgi:UDP-N-acetylglucosamine 4,6-dehydratase/5-epimerase
LFKQQIEAGKPVTLTDREMTRFMMSIPQAAKLVLKAAELAKGGEVFVLKMPVLKIEDLAQMLIDDYNEKFDGKYTSEIAEVGVRPGEKVYEELMTLEESERAYENEIMYAIYSHLENEWEAPEGFEKADRRAYSSHNSPLISAAEIHQLLHAQGLTF